MRKREPLTAEQQELFDEHMGYAEAIAEKRINRHVDIEDRTQAAFEGLLDAVRGFDPEGGVRFQTYAYKRIWGAIRDAERLPGNMMIHHGRASRAKGNPEPKTILAGAFDRPGDEGRGLDGNTHVFVDPHADPAAEIEAREAIEAAFGCLLATERRIVRAYWLEGKTMKAVGAEIGASESRVSQVMPGLIDRLREHSALAHYAKGA